jgi:hypothetical protein
MNNDFTYTPSGTIDVDGVASTLESNDFTYTPSGTVTIDGVASTEESNDFTYTPSGTITVNGEASTEESNDYEYTTSGTIIINGEAITLKILEEYIYSTSGEITIDGDAKTIQYNTSTIIYVDTGVTGGDSDGSSWANAYPNLNAWITDTSPVDLISQKKMYHVYCRASNGDTDTTGITIGDTWNGDSRYYLSIEVPLEYRHDGIWNNSRYSIIPSASRANGTITVKGKGVHINGLQISSSSIDDSNQGGIFLQEQDSNFYVIIENCIIRGISGDTRPYVNGIQQVNTGNGKLIISNNIIYGWTGSGEGTGAIALWDYGVVNYIYNNTLYNNTNSIYQPISGGDIFLYNNISNESTNGYNLLGYFTGLKNITDVAGDTTGGDTIFYASLSFGDTSSYNYLLSSGDTLAINNGYDLTSDNIWPVTKGIKGNNRISIDIGADEFSDAYEYTPSGTIIINGSSSTEETSDYEYTPSGTVTIDGEASTEETSDYEYTPSGTVTIDGEASTLETAEYTYTPSGAVVINGSASTEEESNNYEYTPSGTVTVNGEAYTEEESNNYEYTSFGTVTIDGSASTLETGGYLYTSSGSIIIDGSFYTEEESNNYEYISSGTITVNGEASTEESNDYEYTTSGTIAVDGVASTEESNNHEYTPSGAVLVDGVSETILSYVNFIFIPSGIINVDGNSSTIESNNYEYTPSGTVIVNGVSKTLPANTYDYIPTGNIIANGISETELAYVNFIFISSGTVDVDGISITLESNNYDYVSSGNITVDGTLFLTIDNSYIGLVSIETNGTSSSTVGFEFNPIDSNIILSGHSSEEFELDVTFSGKITVNGEGIRYIDWPNYNSKFHNIEVHLISISKFKLNTTDIDFQKFPDEEEAFSYEDFYR